MPLLPNPDIKTSRLLFHGHLETIIPSLFRKVEGTPYQRERIILADGDFLDLDWSATGKPSLAILSHGLEGDTERPYIKGMAKSLNQAGFDVLAWNYRGCSGEPNQTARAYHSGATDDLEAVLQHVWKTQQYEHMALVGFSLGGNITLKYVGEQSNRLDPRIKSAVGISVPCDLEAGAIHLGKLQNRIYLRRFLKSLRTKLLRKQAALPEHFRHTDYRHLQDFFAFDDFYTGPAHGYKDALTYYRSCSSRQYISGITIPTLLLNALNDPFLPAECYPETEALQNPNLHLEIPARGGHVGFCLDFRKDQYYSEERTVAFLKDYLPVEQHLLQRSITGKSDKR
jgi:predicted alpha/beta-fold hydrolase